MISNFKLQISNSVTKLRSLPETKKKIILFAIIGICALVIGFFQVRSTVKQVAKIQESVKSITWPEFSIPHSDNKLEDISKLIGELKEGGDPLNGWQTYQNEEHGFSIFYPPNWQVDTDRTSSTEMVLLSMEGDEQAAMHLELVNITKKTTSAESGIEVILKKMKEVVMPKTGVTIGQYAGYEAIGTLCVQDCANSKQAAYYPFSVIYLGDIQGKVIEFQYGEGTQAGWKKDIKEWKRYEEFKKIITTFNYTK